MALTYAQRDAVTKKFFINKITQQAYDSVVFLKRIAKGKRVKVVSGGKKVYHPIRYQQLGTSQFIDPDSARVVQNVDTRTALELNWTYQVTDWVITMREKVENRGDAQALFEKLQEGKKKRNVGDKFKHIVSDNWKVDMVATFNIRSLKNYFDLRDSGAAWFQIQWLAQAMKEVTPVKYLKLIDKEYRNK